MKCALVTGGSRGIGRAASVKLASMGYHVLVNYKTNLQEAEITLGLIQEAGGSGALLPLDVTSRIEVQQVLEGWIASHPEDHIEVLVNNAGIKDDALMVFMKDEQWDRVLDTSLDAFFSVTRIIAQKMAVKRFGRIINMVSLSGQKGMPGQVNYSAAKGAVIAATKSLSQELGKRNITVNAIAPGFIRTDMTEGIEESEWKERIPVGRFGTPEEVAHLLGFLVTPEAAYITGQVIGINGGLYAGS
jgi:3-oxoacyl-[acyl-carrier protein] reductase